MFSIASKWIEFNIFSYTSILYISEFNESKVDSTVPFFQALMKKDEFYNLGTYYPHGYVYKNGLKVKDCGGVVENCINQYVQ